MPFQRDLLSNPLLICITRLIYFEGLFWNFKLSPQIEDIFSKAWTKMPIFTKKNFKSPLEL